MKSAFDLKSARLEAFTLRLFTADLAAMTALLDEKAAQYAKFANMPFILDATRINRADELDFTALVAAFAARDMRVVALKHGKKDWSEAAKAAGLLWLDGGKKANRQPENKADDAAAADAGQPENARTAQAGETANESTAATAKADGTAAQPETQVAGESGDTSARIFLQSMQAELVSIAGIYRVFEQDLPPSLHKKAVQIELQEDERLAIFAINAN